MARKEGNLFELKKTVLIVDDEEINRDFYQCNFLMISIF